MSAAPFPITPPEGLAEFCRRWQIARLWVFGSLATGAARPDSDADVLVEFLPHAIASTWDWPQMQDELRAIFHREIDLLSMGVLQNPLRGKSILATRRLLYEAVELAQHFWVSKSIEQLALEQHTVPKTSIADLRGDWPADESIDDFLEFLHQGRQ